MRVLMEARRILRPDHKARLLVVEPFRRWWGQRVGFSITWGLSTGTEPLAVAEDGLQQYTVFQYIVAQLEPSRCVVCARLPGRVYPKGFHLCMNCEYGDVGARPRAGRDSELSSSELGSPCRRRVHHTPPSRQRVRSPMGRQSDRRDGSRRRPPRLRSRSRRGQNRQRRSRSSIRHSPRRRSRRHRPADSELRSPCFTFTS